jgi:hypothetical protein
MNDAVVSFKSYDEDTLGVSQTPPVRRSLIGERAGDLYGERAH